MVPPPPRLAGVLLLGAALTACQSRPAPPPPPPPASAPAEAAPAAPAAASAAPAAQPAPGAAAPAALTPSSAPTPGPSPQPPAEGAVAPPAAPVPAGPAPVTIVEAVAVIVGAAEPLRLTGDPVTVDPGATFRVVLRGRFADARLSLLDASDDMVAGAGGREAAEVTTVTFQPAAPLRPAATYRLRVDGAATRELHAADGTPRAPVEVRLVAAGEPEPKQKPRTRKKRP